MEFYDIQMYNEADMYVKWNAKEGTFETIAIICNGKGIVLDQTKMGNVVLSKNYNENFDWTDLKKVDKVDSCYVERISGKEKTWYLNEESELRQYDKHKISDEDFTQITNMYKKACHWVFSYDCNEIDYIHKTRPGFKDGEKKEFDQIYDIINLI
ncbi:hypothetical protein G6F36_013014 [Rhizopus arrhizus]|nr:hypothetical protein G6F36_013014 [Rhizopus arrhizus]